MALRIISLDANANMLSGNTIADAGCLQCSHEIVQLEVSGAQRTGTPFHRCQIPDKTYLSHSDKTIIKYMQLL